MIAGAGGRGGEPRRGGARGGARPPAAFQCPGARAAPTSSTLPSLAAPPHMGSNSMMGTARARCIRAARSCPPCSPPALPWALPGTAAIEAMVAGYETTIAIARACHPELRQRGFHPTGACAVFGAAAAVAKLRGLRRPRSPTRSASPRAAPPACSRSSMGAPTSSACMPATRRVRDCRPCCSPNKACTARPASSKAATVFGRLSRSDARHGARDCVAAGGAVRNHRLLHQTLRVLPAYPTRDRGADRTMQRRGGDAGGGYRGSMSIPIASPPSTPQRDGTTPRARS